jgi:hypothetical protein
MNADFVESLAKTDSVIRNVKWLTLPIIQIEAMTKVTNLELYPFHKEIALYYFKTLNEVLTLGIAKRDGYKDVHLVGFWKIKKLKL